MSAQITELSMENVLAVADLATVGKLRKLKNKRIQGMMDARFGSKGFFYNRVEIEGRNLYPISKCRKYIESPLVKDVELTSRDVCDIVQCRTLHLSMPIPEILEECVVPAAATLCKNVQTLIVRNDAMDWSSVKHYGKIMEHCHQVENIDIYGDDESVPEGLIKNMPQKIERPIGGQKIFITIEPVLKLSEQSMAQLIERAGQWPIEIRLWIDHHYTEIEETMAAVIYLFKNAKSDVAVRWASGEACRWKERFEDRIMANFDRVQKLLAPPEGAECWFGGDAEKRMVFKVGDNNHYMSYYCPRPPFDYRQMIQPDYL